MFHNVKSKMVTVLLLLGLCVSSVSAADPQQRRGCQCNCNSACTTPPKDGELTDAQLHAFLGIVTNFLLSDDAKKVLHFSSSATVIAAENQLSSFTVAVSGAEGAVTYRLSGGDSGLFSINSTTGAVVFKSAPDFETKDTYSFTATATDGAGNSATQSVTINITDLPEGQAPKKTGQTKSYDEDGNEVTDGSIKDDGFYQKGTTPSYTRDDATEIVTDHITGLQWQDDEEAKTVTKQWLTDANYDICKDNNSAPECYDTSGDTAATYCADLTLGEYSDWRLPTIDELMYIVDRSKRDPAIDTTVFENVVSDFYWSSSTVVGDEGYAWLVYFRVGYDYWDDKSYRYYVRCVRVGQ